MALLTFDKSCWCYKRRKWKIRKAKALSLGKCEKALQVNVFSKHTLNQLLLIKMLKPLLTHKSLDMSAGIPTFRAAELVPPFPWSSRARHSLPFTDAFLCKHGCQLKYTNKQQKKKQQREAQFTQDIFWCKPIYWLPDAPQIYLSAVGSSVFCCPIFRAVADSRLWKHPHTYPGREKSLTTALTTKSKGLEPGAW